MKAIYLCMYEYKNIVVYFKIPSSQQPAEHSAPAAVPSSFETQHVTRFWRRSSKTLLWNIIIKIKKVLKNLVNILVYLFLDPHFEFLELVYTKFNVDLKRLNLVYLFYLGFRLVPQHMYYIHTDSTQQQIMHCTTQR